MQTKYCGSCQTIKPIEQFTSSKRAFKYSSSQSTHSYCKVCNAKRAKEWRDKNPKYKGTGRLKSIPQEDRLLMSAIRQRLVDARTRCKKLKREAPMLSDTYLYELFKAQNGACALTGALLAIQTNHSLCLSLDQKDPAKGYIEGNVQWLAWCVNRAKGDLHIEDFYDMCETVLEYRKVQRLSRKGVEPSGSKRGTPVLQDEDIVCST
jgi:hypothetical protein